MATVTVSTSDPHASLATVANGDTVVFEAGGTYTLSSRLAISDLSGLTIEGNGATVRVADGVSAGAGEFNGCLALERCTGVTLSDLTLDGNRSGRSSIAESYGNSNLVIIGGSDYTLRDLSLINPACDGLYLRASTPGTLSTGVHRLDGRRITIEDAYRNGVSIIAGRYIFLSDVTVRRSDGTLPKAGLDVESNPADADHANDSIRVVDFTAEDCDGPCFQINNTAAPRRVVASRLRSIRCARGAVLVAGQGCRVYDVRAELTEQNVEGSSRAVLGVVNEEDVSDNRLYGWTITGDDSSWLLLSLPESRIDASPSWSRPR